MKKFLKHGISMLLLVAVSIIPTMTAKVNADRGTCVAGGNHTILQMDYRKPLFTEAGWEAYEYCTKADCDYTTFKAIPPLGEPEIDDYGTFVENLAILEVLANEYVIENPGNDPLELIIKYIRTGVDRYNSGSWGIMAGYEDKAFADFVRRTENAINYEIEDEADYLRVTALKNINNFYLPNGDFADIGHMFGTLDISYTNKTSLDHADVGGWAGDLVDLITSADADGDKVSGTIEEMVAMLTEEYFLHNPQEHDVFSLTDFCGDLDAYYVFNTILGNYKGIDPETELGTLTTLIMEYFTEDLSQEDRAEYFLRNRLGNAGTREQVRRAVYNAYTGNKTVTTLEATREFITDNDNIRKLREASCYAFADYICRLAGDFVEIESNPYYSDFNVETSNLAPGIVHETHTATTADGKQIVYYTATADLSNEHVTVNANYNDCAPENGWKMSRVLDQANAAQKKYGDPESEDYIENYQVIVSVNADGFDMQTGKPGGLLVMEGVEYSAVNASGFFGITKEGKAVIGTKDEYNKIYKNQLRDGVGAFGVTLVKDGKIAVAHTDNYTTDRASRTAIGITKTGKVVMMVLDGRQEPRSCGGSMQEIAQIMLEAGCYHAVNLDGGGSTTMVTKPEGKEELEVSSKPSDGYARSVSTSLLMVSTAPSSTKFDHARLDSESNYVTVGTPVKITPVGLSATGNAVDLPENCEWRIATYSSDATITEDGVFCANTVWRDYDIELVCDGEVIGQTTIHAVEPNKVYFTRKTLDAVYGTEVEIPVSAAYNGNDVAINENDVVLTIQPASVGTINGYKLSIAENATVKNVSVIATLKSDEEIVSTMSINLYKEGENSFNFEKATGGDRQFAWDRSVSNALTDDAVSYIAIDSDKDMETSYVFAIDMKEITIPTQLEDLTYMLPGADAVDASAWNFLLQLAERVSVLTEVKPVLKFDERFEVDYSELEVINDYFYLDSAVLDEEKNELALTLKWHDQTESIPAETANPLCMLKGIKLIPKDDAFVGDKVNAVHVGAVEYTIYLRANALYTFTSKPENQATYGLYPFENTFIDPYGVEQYERGGWFHDVYTEFEDRYTLSRVQKSGWVNEAGGFAYYIDGKKITGVQLVDGFYYDFGETGINVGQTKYTGFFEKEGKTYYALNGELITDKWQIVGDKMYHCHTDGASYITTVKDPTSCVVGGFITYTCTNCKKTNKSSKVYPEGHDWDENYKCRICGKVGQDIANATIGFGSVTNPRDPNAATPKYVQTTQGVRPSTYVTFDGKTALSKSNDNNLDDNNKIIDVYMSWTNDNGIGKAYTHFTGRGDYYGTGKSLEYIILPGSVSNIKATPGSTSVTLTWSKAIKVGTYRIFRAETKNGKIVRTKLDEITGTSYTVTGLTPGKTYTFSIATSAVSTDGENKTYNGSSWADVSVTTVGCANHTWDEGKVTTSPTHTAEGVKTYTCTSCKEQKTETIAALGHTYGEWVSDGDKIHKQVCSCGSAKTEAHKWNSGVITVEPTFTTEGLKTYTCTSCGETKTENLAILDHTHNYDEGVTTPATCTEAGNVTYTCTICGDKKVVEIPASGHYIERFVREVAATCTKDGAKAHYICSDCGAKFADGDATEELTDLVIPALGHAYSDWTSADDAGHKKVCSNCGDEALESHAWDEGVVTKEPTVTQTGVKTYTCTVCGGTKTTTLPTISHTHAWGEGETIAPTCTEAGKTTYTCSCGETKVETIPALGHAYGDWEKDDEDNHKKVCSNCGDKVLDAHAWNDGEVTTAPTHTEEGVKTYTCTVCSEEKTEAIDKLKDHAWDEGVVTTAPTHTKDGVKTYTCICGETKTESIPKDADSHTYGEWKADGKDNHKKVCECGAEVVEAHVWDDGKITVQPDEYVEGEMLYTCTVCGETDTKTIPATGHVHSMTKVEAIAPTCTKAGNVEYYRCNGCGNNYETEDGTVSVQNTVIPALGHAYGDFVADGDVHKKECANCGETVTDVHAWDDGKVTVEPTYEAEGVKTYTCTVCDAQKTTSIPVIGHTHTWGKGVITTPATCAEDGIKTYTCTVCGDEKTESIPALGHYVENYVSGKAPTCTEDGSKEYFVCSDCGAKFADASATEELTDVVIPALGHTYGDFVADGDNHKKVCSCGDVVTEAHKWNSGVVTVEPTYTTEGVKTYTCSVCNATRTEKMPIVDHTHEYDEGVVTIAPTHLAEGVKTFTCALCGDKKTEAIAKTLAHEYGEGVVTVAPTHLAEGVMTYTCSCGDKKTESIAKLTAHEYGEGVVTVAPTHTTEGVMTYTCICGETKTEAIAKLTAHEYGEGVVTVEPTHTSEGVMTYTCSCGETKTEAIAKTSDHEYGEGVVTLAPTCTVDGVMTFTCTCGDKKTEVIPATGHSYGDFVADGDVHKKTCTCGDVVTEAHTWNNGVVTVEPTYTTEGVMTYTCTACGATKTEKMPIVDHTHAFDEGVVTVAPTHTAEGVKTFTCSICGEQRTEVIAKTPDHSYEVAETPATCTEDGVKTFTCICGDTYTEVIPATGHNYEVVETPATCTEAGSKVTTCTICRNSKTEVIPALGHAWDNGVVTVEPTYTADGVKTFTCSNCGEQRTEKIDKLTPEYMPGDVDGNGLIETRDIILVRRYIAGGYGVEINIDAADVDKNGLIETRDIILMRRYIAGGYGVELK